MLEIDLQVFRIANPDKTGCWDSKNPNDGAQFHISGETEILLAIGEELGQKGMPPCHYPPKNAKKTLKICSTIW